MSKFSEGQFVRSNVDWPLAVVRSSVSWMTGIYGKVVSVGGVYRKDKKGNPILVTYSYMIIDDNDDLHYFLEDELK